MAFDILTFLQAYSHPFVESQLDEKINGVIVAYMGIFLGQL